MIDYNQKYIFVAIEDSWFKKGTECTVEGGALWDLDIRDFDEDRKEIPYKRMVDNPDRINGIFNGIRIADGPPGELQKEGEEYEDGEVCVLDEFKIIKR